MRTDVRQATLSAARQAARVRRTYGIPPDVSFCVYDLAERMGIEVKFVDNFHLEGLYAITEGPVILINTRRPAGRQRFTCAHEIGHHVLRHGLSLDENGVIGEGARHEEKERIADWFAGQLLMPRSSIIGAMKKRDWRTTALSDEQVFIIAGNLGVGYKSLLVQMSVVANVMDRSRARQLEHVSPRDIKARLLEDSTFRGDLLVVDAQWSGRPIEIQVGDRITVPLHAKPDLVLLKTINETRMGKVLQGVRPGQGVIMPSSFSNMATTIRVSRNEFSGRSQYRYLKDEDYAVADNH